MKNLLLNAYVKMQMLKTSMVEDESGQDLVEYALVVGVISLGALAALPGVATAIIGLFTSLATSISGAAPAAPAAS
jgi:pilus assembly protein Flp/PilA